jgi:Holliday junction resolvase RusA-like endonuclease
VGGVDSLVLTVYGEAQPAGSKRALYHSGMRYPAVVDANPASKGWKNLVATEAAKAWDGPLLDGPLALEVAFYRPRPAAHFGTGRNAGVVKTSAPAYPTSRPDVTKLLRGVEDALTGIVWRDDARVVRQRAEKFYGEPARVEIKVCLLAIQNAGRLATGLLDSEQLALAA